LGSFSLAGFFETIERHLITTVTVRPGEITRIELGNIGSRGERRDIRRVEIPESLLEENRPVMVMTGIKGQENAIEFTSSSSFVTLMQNFRTELKKSCCLSSNVEIINIDNSTRTFEIATINFGVELAWLMTINNVQIPAIQIQNPIRYPNGRCKFMFLMPNFGDITGNVTMPGMMTGGNRIPGTNVNVLPFGISPQMASMSAFMPMGNNCGSGAGGGTGSIPGSNQKHLEYAFDDEYQEHAKTGHWELINWRRMGKMFVLSSDSDVTEQDMNLNETIWIKNPQNYMISVQVMIAT